MTHVGTFSVKLYFGAKLLKTSPWRDQPACCYVMHFAPGEMISLPTSDDQRQIVFESSKNLIGAWLVLESYWVITHSATTRSWQGPHSYRTLPIMIWASSDCDMIGIYHDSIGTGLH